MKTYLITVIAGLSVLIGCFNSHAQLKISDSLLQAFITPPNTAKPRVWWHWMNGNITKEGIQKRFRLDETGRYWRFSEF